MTGVIVMDWYDRYSEVVELAVDKVDSVVLAKIDCEETEWAIFRASRRRSEA
jgi:hypothetical protein